MFSNSRGMSLGDFISVGWNPVKYLWFERILNVSQYLAWELWNYYLWQSEEITWYWWKVYNSAARPLHVSINKLRFIIFGTTIAVTEISALIYNDVFISQLVFHMQNSMKTDSSMFDPMHSVICYINYNNYNIKAKCKSVLWITEELIVTQKSCDYSETSYHIFVSKWCIIYEEHLKCNRINFQRTDLYPLNNACNII